jgi:hypothetical protein
VSAFRDRARHRFAEHASLPKATQDVLRDEYLRAIERSGRAKMEQESLEREQVSLRDMHREVMYRVAVGEWAKLRLMLEARPDLKDEAASALVAPRPEDFGLPRSPSGRGHSASSVPVASSAGEATEPTSGRPASESTLGRRRRASPSLGAGDAAEAAVDDAKRPRLD